MYFLTMIFNDVLFSLIYIFSSSCFCVFLYMYMYLSILVLKALRDLNVICAL